MLHGTQGGAPLWVTQPTSCIIPMFDVKHSCQMCLSSHALFAAIHRPAPNNMDNDITCHYCGPYKCMQAFSACSMLTSHVPQKVSLLLELPVTMGALKPRFHSTLILDVVLQTLACLVEAPAARALVGAHQMWCR